VYPRPDLFSLLLIHRGSFFVVSVEVDGLFFVFVFWCFQRGDFDGICVYMGLWLCDSLGEASVSLMFILTRAVFGFTCSFVGFFIFCQLYVKLVNLFLSQVIMVGKESCPRPLVFVVSLF